MKFQLCCSEPRYYESTARALTRTYPILLFVGTSLTQSNYSVIASKLQNTIVLDSNPFSIVKNASGIRSSLQSWISSNPNKPFILAGSLRKLFK